MTNHLTDGMSTFDIIDILSSPTAVGVTAFLILVGYIISRLIEKFKGKSAASVEFNRKISNPDIKCPHCSQNLEKSLEDNMAKYYHKEMIIVECPKCRTRSQWDVIGWPPVMNAKLPRAF